MKFTLTLRERIMTASVGVLLFLVGLVLQSHSASAQSVESQATLAPLTVPTFAADDPTPTPAPHRRRSGGKRATKNAQQLVQVADLGPGPIYDPFGSNVAADISATQGGYNFGATSIDGTTPLNPMGFDTDHVPRMDGKGAEATVYALGTNHAILSAGGQMVGVGSVLNGAVIVRIDTTGVYLSNGSVLRPQARGTAAPASPSPGPAATPLPRVGAQVGSPQPDLSTAVQNEVPPTAAPAPVAKPSPGMNYGITLMQQLLQQMQGGSQTAAPSKNPNGGPR